MLKKFYLILVFLFISAFIFNLFSQNISHISRYKNSEPLNEEQVKTHQVSYYTGLDIELENGYILGPYYEIGPEIPVTGLTGFYDYQSNGACMHQLSYISDNTVHAIYMTSFDSLNFSDSRRTKYAFSSNSGLNWTSIVNVPLYRSGFATLTSGNTGISNNAAIIGNHYQPAEQLTAGMHVDTASGTGSFTTTTWNFNTTNFIWPIISALSNGSVLVGAETDQMGIATDTGLIQLFNPNTNSWAGNPKLLVTPADQYGMRWTTASGPNGKGIYVLNAINDYWGTYNGNRIFYWTTTDNGQYWTGPVLLWEGNFDSNWVFHNAYVGIDAIYDYTGNFYVAFNTWADSITQNSIWISKNGGPVVRVAINHQIAGAATDFISPMAGSCSMDWPSLSISDDGQYIFCAYSVVKHNDIINGFQACDIYYSFSQTISLNFTGNGPIQITSGTNDERYVSLNRKAFTQGSGTYVLTMVYQKDPQPGSAAFSDNAPLSRASLIFRKITQAHIFTHQYNEEQNLPANFSLSQNYPNPFNPVTKIKFAIPVFQTESTETKLIIYDIAGREVKTLVQEQLKPGTYEVDWDASNYSSGVYFYKLITESFSETKRMVLIK